MTGIPCIDRAIMQDIVEINYGLDYGSTDGIIDEELKALYISIAALPKYSGSAKAKMLNLVKASSEAANRGMLEKLNKNK